MRRALPGIGAAFLLLSCGPPEVTSLEPGDGTPPPAAPGSAGDPGFARACKHRLEVVVWTDRYADELEDALRAHADPCAEYYISLPAVACEGQLKVCPRGPAGPTRIHSLGPNFHALAEFHWGSWHTWLQGHPGMTWEEAGVEYRRRMASDGYDVSSGDTWEVNEFPSTVREGLQEARIHAEQAVTGLQRGPAGAPVSRGAVFVIGPSQLQSDLVPLKDNSKSWLSDAPFWTVMESSARWFGQEVYADPHAVCVHGSTMADRSSHLNAFQEFEPRLASAGPDSPARAYLDRASLPLLTATWDHPEYHTQIPQLTFERFLSAEVYATREWAETHLYPAGRIGFGWEPLLPPGVDPTRFEEHVRSVAGRLAGSLDAYPGGPAAACPDHLAEGCACGLAGASFNEAWSTFATW